MSTRLANYSQHCTLFRGAKYSRPANAIGVSEPLDLRLVQGFVSLVPLRRIFSSDIYADNVLVIGTPKGCMTLGLVLIVFESLLDEHMMATFLCIHSMDVGDMKMKVVLFCSIAIGLAGV